MGKVDQIKDVELASNAWQRFERAIDVVAKSPPQHRTKREAETPRKVKVRPSKSPQRPRGKRQD